MSTVSLANEIRYDAAVNLPPRATAPHLPRQLSDVEFVVLRGAGPNRRVAAGEVLFRKGEIGHSMYAIETGQVRIEFGDGMPHKLLGPREYFGELALFIGNHARVATRGRAHGVLVAPRSNIRRSIICSKPNPPSSPRSCAARSRIWSRANSSSSRI